jgi:hypothetical protein
VLLPLETVVHVGAPPPELVRTWPDVPLEAVDRISRPAVVMSVTVAVSVPVK